jgi:hypothetical protein
MAMTASQDSQEVTTISRSLLVCAFKTRVYMTRTDTLRHAAPSL